MRTFFCKIVIFFLFFQFLALPPQVSAKGRSSYGTVRVRGYTKRDGTYVQPHLRSQKDSNFNNNWSTKGNYNPYTGKPGYKTQPETIGFSYSIPSPPLLQAPTSKDDDISFAENDSKREEKSFLTLENKTETGQLKAALPIPNWTTWNDKEDPVAFLKKCSFRNSTLTESENSRAVAEKLPSYASLENNIASSSQLSILTEEKIREIKEKLLKNKNHRGK